MNGYELALACLALNIYHEAAFEPPRGQYAVAFVTINRARERRLDICDTVFQNKQFSWTNNARDRNGKLLAKYLPKGKQWIKARQVARKAMNGELQDFTHGATHYHADYIAKPVWAHALKPAGKWGHHYFYR